MRNFLTKTVYMALEGIKNPIVIWVSPYGRDGNLVTFASSEEIYNEAFTCNLYGNFIPAQMKTHIDLIERLDHELGKILLHHSRDIFNKLIDLMRYCQSSYGKCAEDSDVLLKQYSEGYNVIKPTHGIAGILIIEGK